MISIDKNKIYSIHKYMFSRAGPWHSKHSGEPTSHLNRILLVNNQRNKVVAVATYAKVFEKIEGSEGFVPAYQGSYYYDAAKGKMSISEEDGRFTIFVGESRYECDEIHFEYTSKCCYWETPKKEVRKPSPPNERRKGLLSKIFRI